MFSSGCALVSGLDQLGTGPGADAGRDGSDVVADATADTGSGGDGSAQDAGNQSDSGSKDGGSAQDTGAPVDSGPDAQPYPVNTVFCGSYQQSCNTGAQTCCRVANNNYSCVAFMGACSGYPISCDDWKDCGGGAKVCCVDTMSGQTTAVSCQDQGSCNLGTQFVLCDPGAASPCPNAKKCTGPTPGGLSSNYKTCQ